MGILKPPDFCSYLTDRCDQTFEGVEASNGLFLYSSKPPEIAATIENAVTELKKMAPARAWRTWKDLPISGQVIFCEICKAARHTETVIADVTTLNFNLMFEIGFAIGLGIPVIPVRDTSYLRDRAAFEELGALDTIGYLDFRNAKELAGEVAQRVPAAALAAPTVQRGDSVYFVRSPHQTDGAVTLFSELKKSKLRFRMFDVKETPRLSLAHARRSVLSSHGVVAHLENPAREGATVHNARCALVAGIAFASEKAVLMIQETDVVRSIDYRDIVETCLNQDQIRRALEPFIRVTVEKLQDAQQISIRGPKKLLEQIDLGDVAAENEIQGLRRYFVQTAQFGEARRGHARLVIGRKGSGKTAIFYGVRDSFHRSYSHLVLDLKPEGHQFARLRETVLSRMAPGVQEHTLTAFWEYILLCELAHKILFSRHEDNWARRTKLGKSYDGRLERFQALSTAYEAHAVARQGDLPERLLAQVERLSEVMETRDLQDQPEKMTEILYSEYVPALRKVVWEYLEFKEGVWVLVDNLDKGWPVAGASDEDVLIVRALLSATRAMQRELSDRDVELHSLVFLRNDIHEHLVDQTPDRGKDTPIVLDWSDPSQLKEMVRRRLTSHSPLDGSFEEVWPKVFETHVGTQDSFDYILERTLMRPRDVLSFIQRGVEVALNRGHTRVGQDDVRQAELTYSNDQLVDLGGEIRDVFPGSKDVLYEFLECPTVMSSEQVQERIQKSMPNKKSRDHLLRLLMWYCFLGVRHPKSGSERYAYQVRYNLAKLTSRLDRGDPFVIHSAFRPALECRD